MYANSVTEHETSCRNTTLEMGDTGDTNLLVQQVQGQLEAHGLHVGPLEGRGDVHVHVQEPLHVAALLLLLDLQLGQEVDEPLSVAFRPFSTAEAPSL